MGLQTPSSRRRGGGGRSVCWPTLVPTLGMCRASAGLPRAVLAVRPTLSPTLRCRACRTTSCCARWARTPSSRAARRTSTATGRPCGARPALARGTGAGPQCHARIEDAGSAERCAACVAAFPVVARDRQASEHGRRAHIQSDGVAWRGYGSSRACAWRALWPAAANPTQSPRSPPCRADMLDKRQSVARSGWSKPCKVEAHVVTIRDAAAQGEP